MEAGRRYSKEYKDYIAGPAWRARRDARVQKAGGRCEFVTTRTAAGVLVEDRCRRTDSLQVHHNTYERLGNERDGDLDVYCWFHHLIAHLLMKRCSCCGGPALDNDEAAEAWLLVSLRCLQIEPDSLPGWDRLPNKEYFLAEIPSLCSDCDKIVPKEK
jgi:hypothetical protein